MNIKGVFQIWTHDGDYHEINLKECHAWTREGCNHCPDFAAEHADISTGGIGKYNDWTLTIVRTDLGREIISRMLEDGVDRSARPGDDDPGAIELMHSCRRRAGSAGPPPPSTSPKDRRRSPPKRRRPPCDVVAPAGVARRGTMLAARPPALLSGLFGVGGGVISQPGMRLLGLGPLVVIGTALPVIIPDAASGACRYRREGLDPLARGRRRRCPAGLVAAVGGQRRRRGSARRRPPAQLVAAGAARCWRPTGWAGRRRPCRPRSRWPRPTPPRRRRAHRRARRPARRCVAIGVVAGLLSGLLGIGGGVVMVPAFVQLARMEVKAAIATSLVCVGDFAIPGTITARAARPHRLAGGGRAHRRRRSPAPASAPRSRSGRTTAGCASTVGSVPRPHRGARRRRRAPRLPADHGRHRVSAAATRHPLGPAGQERGRRTPVVPAAGSARSGSVSARAQDDRRARSGRQVAGGPKTASSIASVSLPVKVFCWLTWYEQTIQRPSGERRPRRRGRTAAGAARRGPASRLVAERARAPRTPGASSSASSALEVRRGTCRARRASACWPAARTAPAAVIQAPVSAQPVVAVLARRLVGEPGAVQRPVEPVARPVAGEHAAGAVGAVGGRGQADDRPRGRRDRRSRAPAGPSSPRRGRPPASRGHLLPPRHQPGAGAAVDDLVLDQRPGPRLGRSTAGRR